jgi:hypothetical protein
MGQGISRKEKRLGLMNVHYKDQSGDYNGQREFAFAGTHYGREGLFPPETCFWQGGCRSCAIRYYLLKTYVILTGGGEFPGRRRPCPPTPPYDLVDSL